MCMYLYIYIYRPRGMCVFLFSLLRMQGIRVSHIRWLSSLSSRCLHDLGQIELWLARVVYFWKVFTLFFTLECAIKAQNHWTWQVSQQMSDMISGVFSLWCFHCIPDYCMLRLWHMALLVIHPPTFAIRGTGLTSWLWHDAQTGAGLELWEFVLDHAFFQQTNQKDGMNMYEYIWIYIWIKCESFNFHSPHNPFLSESMVRVVRRSEVVGLLDAMQFEALSFLKPVRVLRCPQMARWQTSDDLGTLGVWWNLLNFCG